MNSFLKICMALGVAGLMMFAYGTYARAADCEQGVWSEVQTKLAERGTVEKLSDVSVKILLDKLGPPPGIEGDFDLYLGKQPPLAAIFVVQNGCIVNRIGPVPAEAIDKLLGITNAGERVD